jgi:hypothetical protein
MVILFLALNRKNNKWISDAQWWTGAIVLHLTSNGSTLQTDIAK